MANIAALPPASAAVAERLENADKLQGMPEAGGHALTTEAAEHHAEPQVFGMNATVWVSVAMAIFLAILIFKGVPKVIGGLLDKQIAAIRERLAEAKQLRAEAEALRGEYQAKLANIEAQAAAMLVHAEEESQALIRKAEADAKELVARRTKMAEDKIAAAERTALDAIRAQTADAATAAAAALLAAKHDAGADKAVVDTTIAGLGGAGLGRLN